MQDLRQFFYYLLPINKIVLFHLYNRDTSKMYCKIFPKM